MKCLMIAALYASTTNTNWEDKTEVVDVISTMLIVSIFEVSDRSSVIRIF